MCYINLFSLFFFNISKNLQTPNWLILALFQIFSKGRIPTPPTSLLWLTVSMNNLAGEIPSSICNWSSLQGVNLFQNNLGGTIPECIGNWSSSLLHININKNNFHGKIPENFAKSCMLRSFHFSNNQLEGSLPRSLGNCKDLILVDVGNNNLKDTFPNWLGHLDQLQILLLGFNRFYGHLDKYFEVTAPLFSHLRIIDLSNNEFSGYLPPKFFESLYVIKEDHFEQKDKPVCTTDVVVDGYLLCVDGVYFTTKGLRRDIPPGVLTVSTAIDFSNNKFFGEIPKVVGELHSLLVLNLSHNNLSGPIPTSFGYLSEIESLDLSWNRLEGRIPAQLKNLTFLEVLNLSHNYLVGPIPVGNQFDTFTNDSYDGNLGLCGSPLSTSCRNNRKLKPTPTRNHRFVVGFNWKTATLMGYGCGMVFGMSMGYIIFTTGKPWWLVRMVERVEQKYVGKKTNIVQNKCS